jgi:hypothetical protein
LDTPGYLLKFIPYLVTMDITEKILVFQNEIEALHLSGILNEMNIPHVIKSYHDSVYDGMWQTQLGWGHIEASPEHREEILTIFNEMSK